MFRFIVLSLFAVGVLGASRRHFGQVISPEILGGDNAVQGEFPYQLSIRLYWGKYQFCGAAILNEDTAITAAHCVHQKHTSELEVIAGDLNKIYTTGIEQIFRLAKMIPHPGYVEYLGKHDIAILKIYGKFTFNENVAPIALPTPLQESSGQCTVTGWGGTNTGGYSPNILQKVDVTVISDDQCRDMYGSNSYKIRDNTLCAGDRWNDACLGDTGGPLKCTNEDGSEYLGGVVSWGHLCGDPIHPGIYAQVSYYIDWINSNL